MDKPMLQIALDLTDLGRALELISSIVYRLGGRNIIVEAGTPLVKKYGVLAVELLKKTSGGLPLYADTKTVDAGAIEAEVMCSVGADIVSVLGLADDSTIEDVVSVTHRLGSRTALDLINHPQPLERALGSLGLGVDIVLYHVGVDVQKRLGLTIHDMIDNVRELVERVKSVRGDVLVAVAGGLKPGLIGDFVDAGVDIVVVGGAITRSEKPVDVVREILVEMGVY